MLKLRKNSTDPRIKRWSRHAGIQVKKLRFSSCFKVDRGSAQSAVSQPTYNRGFQIDGMLKAFDIETASLWDVACQDTRLRVESGLELRKTLDLVIDRRNLIAHSADMMRDKDRFLPIETKDVRDALRVIEAVSRATCQSVESVDGLREGSI